MEANWPMLRKYNISWYEKYKYGMAFLSQEDEGPEQSHNNG